MAYGAFSVAFHALANTETGWLHVAYIAFSFYWAVPAFIGLWRATFDD